MSKSKCAAYLRRALGPQPFADQSLDDLWQTMSNLEARLDQARRDYQRRRDYDTQHDLMVKAWFASSWNEKPKGKRRHDR